MDEQMICSEKTNRDCKIDCKISVNHYGALQSPANVGATTKKYLQKTP